MKKSKKFLSALCAICMILSLAVPAGAASFADDPYYFGVDWSQVDTSMCIPGTEYHRYPQSPNSVLASAGRTIFTGWTKGVPAHSFPGASNTTLVTELAFESGEPGVITVTFTDTQDPNQSDINISVYDKSAQVISDYFSPSYNSTAPASKSFNVDPTHKYELFINHQGSGLQNVRLTVTVGCVSSSAGATEVHQDKTLIAPRAVSAEELLKLTPVTTAWDSARICLPKNSGNGTSGEKCGLFTADTEEVVFTIDEATNTLTYHVQLYYADTDQPAEGYECVSVGTGVAFPSLNIGMKYYFKVSSLNCPGNGVNAKFSVQSI